MASNVLLLGAQVLAYQFSCKGQKFAGNSHCTQPPSFSRAFLEPIPNASRRCQSFRANPKSNRANNSTVNSLRLVRKTWRAKARSLYPLEKCRNLNSLPFAGANGVKNATLHNQNRKLFQLSGNYCRWIGPQKQPQNSPKPMERRRGGSIQTRADRWHWPPLKYSFQRNWNEREHSWPQSVAHRKQCCWKIRWINRRTAHVLALVTR